MIALFLKSSVFSFSQALHVHVNPTYYSWSHNTTFNSVFSLNDFIVLG